MKEVHFDTVQQFNDFYGFETLHPLVSVVRFDREHTLEECMVHYGVYALFLKENKGCNCARAILFVSATCPNCKLAISMLEKAGFLFKKVLATENPELANQYGVKQAPTLVVLSGAPGEFEKYKGVSEIKGMLTAKQVG